jgi:hypothetical protein
MNTPTTSGTSVPLWQHKDDRGALNEIRECAPCPAVFMMHEHRVKITKQWQFFIRAINPGMSVQHIAALFGPTKAFTNRPRNDARANHLMGTKLSRPDPEFDKVRTCALSVLTGTVSGKHLIVTMLDGSQEPPLKEGRSYPERVEDINPDDYLFTPQTHRHLFFAANIIRRDGRTVPFPKGAVYDWTNDGKPYTWLPHVKRGQVEVRYPLSKLIELPPGAEIPSPYNFERVKKKKKPIEP